MGASRNPFSRSGNRSAQQPLQPPQRPNDWVAVPGQSMQPPASDVQTPGVVASSIGQPAHLQAMGQQPPLPPGPPQWRLTADGEPPVRRNLLKRKRVWVPIAMAFGFIFGLGAGAGSQPVSGVPASTATRTATQTVTSSGAEVTVTTTATTTVSATGPVRTVTATAPAKTVTVPAPTVTRTVRKVVTKTVNARPTRMGLADTSGSGATDPRFGTCKEALANGYGHYRAGVDVEYDWYRDADSDGVVCE